MNTVKCLIGLSAILASGAAAAPIKVSTANSHYFEYMGQPIIPMTSGCHYAPVINSDFDYAKYVDSLGARGQTYDRIYSGAYFEPPDQWMSGNPLGIANGKHILPWARSSTSGYSGGGNKFDLANWDANYFIRLKAYVQRCADNGVIVEIALFNGQYAESWGLCVFNASNNVQGVGYSDKNDVQTLNNSTMYAYEVAYVKKIVTELNSYDNVMYEICDEPTTSGTDANSAKAWARALTDTIYALEATLSNRHLVTSDEDRPDSTMVNYAHAGWIVGQYYDATGCCGAYGGVAQLLDKYYDKDKPIELNEAEWDEGSSWMSASWYYAAGGIAGYNHCNSSFTVASPTGSSTAAGGVRRAQDFMYSFDFIKMTRDQGCIASIPSGSRVRAISQPGYQYAAVICHDDSSADGLQFSCQGHSYSSENLTLSIKAGTCKYEWVNPATGGVSSSGTFTQASDGNHAFSTGNYTGFIALRVKLANAVPPVPILKTPVYGKSGLAAGSILTWRLAYSATAYDVQVSTNADCSSPVIDDATVAPPSKSVSLAGNTTYYWRVRAQNANGWSAWSAIWTFGTGGATPVASRAKADRHESIGLWLKLHRVNSAQSALRVSIPAAVTGDLSVSLYDMRGRCLRTVRCVNPVSGAPSIDLGADGLGAGRYVVKIRAAGFGWCEEVALSL